MKLIMDGVWSISKNHLKILEAAEFLSKSHNYFKPEMLKNRSKLKANFHEHALDLINLKFITYRDNHYKLSISGMDSLAINSLRKRGLEIVGSQVGIGKESDIFIGQYKGKEAIIKIHRLGRSCYTKIADRELRETNWLAINKESCTKEAYFMNLFGSLEIPQIYDFDRHIIVMESMNYDTLYKMKIENYKIISEKMFQFIKKLYGMGYVHGDFNEFNILVKGDDMVVIDFPQVIKIDHPRAKEYLKRDIECVNAYFWKKNLYLCDYSSLSGILREMDIDISLVEIEKKQKLKLS